MSVWGVVVAAGRGARSGLDRNKVFFEIDGRSVLSRCLDAFADPAVLDGVALVISREDEEEYRALTEREGACPLVKIVVYGGATRQESVYNGLLALPEDTEVVAVHDAARPFVTREIVRETVASALRFGSGVIAVPVVDTIKQIDAGGRVTSLDRSTLRAGLTPHALNYRRLLEYHRRAREDGVKVTDDAMLFEHYEGNVRLVYVEGAERNIKLTTKADFERLNMRQTMDFRVGHGYDAHRLAEARKLVLCGVEIPHERGLDGHSDADVAVHALMDALLGALGLGDIGAHFPDSDARSKGISSMTLLETVMEEVRGKGWSVVNADITIVAQRPRLAPYIAQMRQRVATGLGVSPERVNVKATTTERMGFEGEEQGISAQAVALLTKREMSV